VAEGPSKLTRARLEALVEGRSDAEINQLLGGIGTEAALNQVFAVMADVVGETMTGLTALSDDNLASAPTTVLQWDVSAPDAIHSYQLIIDHGVVSTTQGAPGQPRVIFAVGLADAARLAAGRLDGMKAFMNGRLKVSGDMMFARSLRAWFPS